LKSHVLIRREPGSATRAALDRLAGVADLPPHRLVQFGSREGVVSAVAEGMGLGAIFDDGVLPGNRVTKLAIMGAGISSKVDVVCLAERRTSQLISGFLTIARGYLRDRPAPRTRRYD
jgi:DNA-binding transcriptional LysR family regulator